MDTIREVDGVKEATWMNWFGGKDPNNPDAFFANFAVEAKTFLDVYDEVELSPEERTGWLTDRQGAIVGSSLAKQLHLKVGDKFTMQGTIFPGDWTFNVDGIYTSSRKSFDQSSLIFHWDYLNESLSDRRKDQIGWVVSRVKDGVNGFIAEPDADALAAPIARLAGDHALARRLGEAGAQVARREAAGGRVGLGHGELGGAGEVDAFRDLGADRVVLVGRDGDGHQDAEDRDDDHQFDQGEALLELFHGVSPRGV